MEIQCSQCGYKADISSRFCKKCGNSLWIKLDSATVKSSNIFDVLNSVYNLISDKSNPDRFKFIDKRSDEVVWKRTKMIYESSFNNIPLMRGSLGLKGFDYDLNPLYQASASDSLSGYAIRLSEELLAEKISKSFSIEECENVIKKYVADGERLEGDKFLFKDFNDHLERRLIFCEALAMYHNYSDFILIDKNLVDSVIDVVFSKNNEGGLKVREKVLSEVYGWEAKRFQSKVDQFADEIMQDLSFGYFLRLSESLMPY